MSMYEILWEEIDVALNQVLTKIRLGPKNIVSVYIGRKSIMYERLYV